MHLAIIGNGATAVDLTGRRFVNRHTARFLLDLASDCHGVTYIEPQVSMQANGNLQDSELPPESVRSLPIAKNRPIDLWRVLRVLWQADLVYIFFPGTLPRAVARWCRLVRKPYAIYLRGEQFDLTGSDADVFRAARFVCCVGGLGDRVRPLNTQVIPIQPMLDIGPADAHRRAIDHRRQEPWNMLFVGRLEAAKGVPELVRAAELLQARGFPFRLLLVGGGPLHAALYDRFGNEPGATIRVAGIIDNKTQLHAAYEAADLFVLPTHHEGFPRVLYEAMMKSNLILTTFVGGIPGVMCDQENALRIPVGDAEAIASTVVAATADLARMQALIDAALDTVLGILQRHPTHHAAVTGRLHA